jgi:hypothetical protein
VVKQKLGEKTEQYCRKIPLQSLARPHMLEKLRANVVTLCTHVREITVRTQVFVNWYILTRLEAGQDVPNYIYSQNSFYSICQLVIGKSITSTNTKMPHDILSSWNQFHDTYPGSQYDMGSFCNYSDALALECRQLATIYLNQAVENFEIYVAKLCRHKLALANPVCTQATSVEGLNPSNI